MSRGCADMERYIVTSSTRFTSPDTCPWCGEDTRITKEQVNFIAGNHYDPIGVYWHVRCRDRYNRAILQIHCTRPARHLIARL